MPSLSKIEISNYRAFYESQTVPIAVNNGRPGGGLTVIVGANNSGKSTILDALLLLKQGAKVPREERHGTDTVIIKLEDTDGGVRTISNTDGGSQLSKTGNCPFDDGSFEFAPSRRHWSPRFRGESDTSAFRQNSYTVGRPDGMDDRLGARLASINRDTAKKERFNSLLRGLLPTFNTWTVETDNNGDFIEYTTRGGASHQTNRFGDGLISLFRIVAHLVETDASCILLVDEPELSLHPQAQRALAHLLSEASSTRQVIISTHSPHFVRWQDIEAGAKIVRVQKRGDVKSQAFFISDSTSYSERLSGLLRDWHKPMLLDAVAKELFFADNVVFVEGQEDVALLNRFIASEDIHTNFEFFGYGSGGAGNIRTFLGMAKDLGLEAAAIFDGDKAELAGACRCDFPNFKIEVLPTDDIRDKFKQEIVGGRCLDTAEVVKEGIFDSSGYVKENNTAQLLSLIRGLVTHFDRPIA